MKSVLGRMGEGKGYCVLLTLLASETMHCRQLQSLNRIFLQRYIFTSCRVHLFLCTSHCWNIQTTQSVFLAVPARMHSFEDFSMTSLLTVVLNKQMAIIDLTSQVSSLIKWVSYALAVECFNNYNVIKKHPRCNKGGSRTKTGLAEKYNPMGGQCLLILIGLKVLVMMNLLQNIVISGAQSLLGSKFLIKMTRPQNTVLLECSRVP